MEAILKNAIATARNEAGSNPLYKYFRIASSFLPAITRQGNLKNCFFYKNAMIL